jgi:hypothetical protein
MQNRYLPTLLLYSCIQILELFTNYTKISWHIRQFKTVS